MVNKKWTLLFASCFLVTLLFSNAFVIPSTLTLSNANKSLCTTATATTTTTTTGTTATTTCLLAVPLVQNWEVLRNGAVRGIVSNHPTIPNGDVITTSPLKNPDATREFAVVFTKSGSKYKLGKGATKKGIAAKQQANVKASTSSPSSPPKKQGFFFNNNKNTQKETKTQQQTLAKPKPVVVNGANGVNGVNGVNGINGINKNEISLKDKLRQAKSEYNLNGKSITSIKLKQTYLLVGQPVRSTSNRSQIYSAYRADRNGLPFGDRLTIKTTTTNVDALERESLIYNKITSGILSGQFVQKVEFIPPSNDNKMAALVLESGERNLRNVMSDARQKKGLQGKAMRQAAVALAQCIQAFHTSGYVWTDLKAENFVVVSEDIGNGSFNGVKGIDLESAVPVGSPPLDYSPEACPPEFAKAFLKGEGPDFKVEYNYDSWSFGMLLYELAVGQSYFGKKSDSQITRILQNFSKPDVSAVQDERLRDLIASCLELDPKKRPSITQILLHPYFLTTGLGPLSF